MNNVKILCIAGSIVLGSILSCSFANKIFSNYILLSDK